LLTLFDNYFCNYFSIYVILILVINLKILFKNVTKYDKEIYTDFLKFHQKVFGLKYSLYTAFIIGLLLILVAMQIRIHNIDIAIILCFVITGFFLWRYLHPASEVSKEFNSEKIQDKKEFTFTFYEKIIKIRENDKLETYVINYKELYRVYETKDFFYIYTDSRHSLLININSFIIGNSDDFSKFIKKKCKFKYKIN